MTDGEQRRGFLPHWTLRRLARSLVFAIELRLQRLAAAWSHEAHRLIALPALSIAAASFVVAAVAFAAFGLIALLLIRRNLRTVHRRKVP